jgi:hypothetical protein
MSAIVANVRRMALSLTFTLVTATPPGLGKPPAQGPTGER